jgi:hypothetical protein
MGEPWFGAKDYGIGLSPKTGAGWAALALYVAAMGATTPLARRLAAPHWSIGAAFAILTAAFVVLVFLKGGRQAWRWRWGGR